MPTTATSYDGVERDISKFYEDKQTNLYVDGYIILDTKTKVNIGFDNGIKTNKFKQSNTYKIGVTQAIDITPNSYITIGGSTAFGGNISETPCKDDYDREYYCGNLTAWTDYERQENEQNYNSNITYTWRF